VERVKQCYFVVTVSEITRMCYVIPRSISHYFLPAIRWYSPPSNNKRRLGDDTYCGSSYRCEYLVSPRQVYYENELSIISFLRKKSKFCFFCTSFMSKTDRQADNRTDGDLYSALNLTEGEGPSFTHWYH
jgi:hypothetical protein